MSFFPPSSARFLAGAATVASIPKLHGLPEVIVTGRANVGKSSLLNAIVGTSSSSTPVFFTSKKAGRTRQLNFCRIGEPDPGRIVLVDTPGYGAKGKDEWGKVFDHYLQTRSQLRRLFILINAKNGLNDYDRAMAARLSELHAQQPPRSWSIQPVITKVDAIPSSSKNSKDIQSTISQLQAGIQQILPMALAPILTSVEMKPIIGVDTMRNAILEACGLS